ncbi:MAG: prepilin-type N-terminal cleavage/methylation domain-containing protein [Phycisphaerae bacterium]|jgi:prepilin-type N-terminal cleavage/methylation domain-containing protein|nr:prepilin-type N-terminal cleavage/methylation domain-containing protein [Phycisphaerae bacterium]
MPSTSTPKNRCQTPFRCTKAAARRRTAFTLAEVMIAIGILGVGMAMVASVFPAAIKANRLSTNSTLGTIICENGLAMAKLVFTADVSPYGSDADRWEVSNTTLTRDRRIDEGTFGREFLPITEQHYPNGTVNNPNQLGYAVLIRKIDLDDDTNPSGYKKQEEGYQICSVAYRKQSGGSVSWGYVQVGGIDNDGGAQVKIIGNDIDLRQGSPLIFVNTGDYGIIMQIDRTVTPITVTLDRPILSVNKTTYALILKEDGEPDRSPAIATMFTRTGLRP